MDSTRLDVLPTKSGTVPKQSESIGHLVLRVTRRLVLRQLPHRTQMMCYVADILMEAGKIGTCGAALCSYKIRVYSLVFKGALPASQ
jgi:hypothetical protein